MASEPTTESSSLSRRPSILVADDEPRLLKTLADLLRSRGNGFLLAPERIVFPRLLDALESVLCLFEDIELSLA